jgi:hypothetical protein
MDILIVVMVVIAIGIGRNLLEKRKGIRVKKEKCKLHKWVRKGEGDQAYLICSVCDLLPGTDIQRSDSEGEY